ncbi:MAG TPA: hypothetical protein VH986_08990 [Acidimicrobiia bacterium]|jgi:hypothetical protein
MRNARPRASLAAVAAAEVAGLVALARLGNRRPFDLPLDRVGPWLRADPVDVLAAALRVVALALAAWILLTTLLYVVARAAHLTRASYLCAAVTPRVARRVVERAVATSVVLAAMASPAGARVRVGVAGGDATVESTAVTGVRDGRHVERASPATGGTSTPTSPSPAGPSAATTAAGTTVVVVPGDNLWDLSTRALAAATARDRYALDDAEVARYWVLVCDTNRDRLLSGDANLVYPGEVVTLPPVDDTVS